MTFVDQGLRRYTTVQAKVSELAAFVAKQAEAEVTALVADAVAAGRIKADDVVRAKFEVVSITIDLPARSTT